MITEMPLHYRTVRVTVEVIFRIIARREFVGMENFQIEPPYIVAPNHISIFDTPLVFALIPHRALAFTAEKHRHNPLIGPLTTAMGTIWVRRGEVDRRALSQALDWLRQGGILGVAPEGTRAREPYVLQEGKTGIAFLATRTNVPVLPVGIAGTENLKENLPRLRRTGVRIAVGEPIYLPQNGRARGAELREYTDLIMRHIADLLPEEYRGAYA